MTCQSLTRRCRQSSCSGQDTALLAIRDSSAGLSSNTGQGVVRRRRTLGEPPEPGFCKSNQPDGHHEAYEGSKMSRREFELFQWRAGSAAQALGS